MGHTNSNSLLFKIWIRSHHNVQDWMDKKKFFIIYKSLRAICHLAERKHQSSPCLQQTTKEKKEEVTQVMPGEVRTMLRHPAGRKITGAALGFQ